MNQTELLNLSLELMNKANLVYLSTVTSEGYPETRGLLNLKNQNQFPRITDLLKADESNLVTYLTTNTSSNKMTDMTENSKICLYYCEGNHGLMLKGDVEIVTDKSLKSALYHDAWKVFFPLGTEDPDYTILKLKPTLAKGYYNGKNYSIKL
jgi:general stress protein 26